MSINFLDRVAGRRIVDAKLKIFELGSCSDISLIRIKADGGFDFKIECNSSDDFVRVADWTPENEDVVDDEEFGRIYFATALESIDLNTVLERKFVSYNLDVLDDGLQRLNMYFDNECVLSVTNVGDQLNIELS